MFILDDSKVTIKKVRVCSFKELYLEERNNLQDYGYNDNKCELPTSRTKRTSTNSLTT